MCSDDHFARIQKEIGGGHLDAASSVESTFGPFAAVVERYEQNWSTLKRVDDDDWPKLTQSLCHNGTLTSSLNGQVLNWRKGIAALWDPDSGPGLGAAASEHLDALGDLFQIWTEFDESIDAEPKYQKSGRTGLSLHEALLLGPHLPIENREFLDDRYVQRVLKPYARARIECRRLFWSRLRQGHIEGLWICFQPLENGTYLHMLPGVGFSGDGSYQIDRETYRRGFRLTKEEVEDPSYQSLKPYPNQDAWCFLDSDFAWASGSQPEANSPALQARKRKPGRPKGTGFQTTDEPFVEQGVEMLLNGQANSATEAARLLAKANPEGLRTPSVDGAIRRLARQIRKKLKEERK